MQWMKERSRDLLILHDPQLVQREFPITLEL